MSRPLRIEYPDAWYHIMNRGRRHEKIFKNNKDYILFINLLKETVELFNIKIAAFSLMQNHYHLLAQTPRANLSRCMRHINGIYTQRFNRLHGYDGHLFRGRYKSVLIDADSYLLQLVRYIHRNPLRAGLSKDLNYPWSSHEAYTSKSTKWEWVAKDIILGLLDNDKKRQTSTYRQFMLEDDPEDIVNFYSKKKLPPIIGSDKFIAWVKDSFFDKKKNNEVPESKVLAPDIDKIKDLICKYYKVEKEVLLESKRGSFNEPRNLTIYFIRQLRGEKFKEICRDFGLKKDSSVGSILNRIRTQMVNDRQFRNRAERLRMKLIKS